MQTASFDLKLLPVVLDQTHFCALCNGPGAVILIARKARGCSESHGDGVLSDVAVVHREHLAPGLLHLPRRTRELAIAGVWSAIDERHGRLGVAVRVAPVRSPLAAGPRAALDPLPFQTLLVRFTAIVRRVIASRAKRPVRAIAFVPSPHKEPPVNSDY